MREVTEDIWGCGSIWPWSSIFQNRGSSEWCKVKPSLWMPDVKWRWAASRTEKDKKLWDETIGLDNYMAIEFTQHDGRIKRELWTRCSVFAEPVKDCPEEEKREARNESQASQRDFIMFRRSVRLRKIVWVILSVGMVYRFTICPL